jgi:glycine/D-amino acid oxidase-like deaminating enzyme
MAACGVEFAELTAAEVAARWPALSVPEGTIALHQADTSMVPAGRSTATMQRLAREHGARLYDDAPVTGLVDRGDAGVEVVVGTEPRRRTADSGWRVVLTADA